MKRIIPLLITCFFSLSALNAQVVSDEEVDEPYKDYNERPYPATNLPASPEVAGFMAQFEESNVGNLKVFSHFGESLPSDYYFTGKKITEAHKELFTNEYRSLLKAGEAYATYSIKGNEEQHYIIRMPTNKGSNTLILFEVNGEVVNPVQPLAFAYCAAGNCYQQDSWLTDLDGDTDLDVLTKFAKRDEKSGKLLQEYSQVFLQDEQGEFQRVEQHAVELEAGKFNMEELKR